MTGRRGVGPVVVVAGPDGSGKTAVADALAEGYDGPVLRLHHRPQVLPAKTLHDGPVTEPHKHAPYSAWLSLLKVLYLYVDYVLGWVRHLRPWVRRGGAVVFERGWWDLVVDPLRYRLMPSQPVLVALRVLGRLMPRPRMTVVLFAPSPVLAARKAELPDAELRRQMQAWRAQPVRNLRPLFVDVTAPLPQVVATVTDDPRWGRQEVVGGDAETSGRRVALSRRGQVRWNIPAGPRRVAKAVTLLQQPMTASGLALWYAGRATAGMGGFRLLPRASDPVPEATDPVRPHVPPDSLLAVAKSNHPGRFAVLAVSPLGQARALAKVATDDVGRAQLRREAEHQRLAKALPAPLRAPQLRHVGDDALVFDAVAWRPRRQPWRLDVDVARALGAFYRAGADAGGSPPGTAAGLSHGDCAPWNLLLGDDGWYLIDWEEATEDAPAFTDVFHYLVQGHALLGRPTADEILDGIDGRGWVAGVLDAYSQGSGVPTTAAREFLAVYLEASEVAIDRRRADGLVGIRARRVLLGRVSP